jgi:hypothetical protein
VTDVAPLLGVLAALVGIAHRGLLTSFIFILAIRRGEGGVSAGDAGSLATPLPDLPHVVERRDGEAWGLAATQPSVTSLRV